MKKEKVLSLLSGEWDFLFIAMARSSDDPCYYPTKSDAENFLLKLPDEQLSTLGDLSRAGISELDKKIIRLSLS